MSLAEITRVKEIMGVRTAEHKNNDGNKMKNSQNFSEFFLASLPYHFLTSKLMWETSA